MNFRIGFGFDAHKLESGRQLIIGSLHVEHTKGIVAHSDGDVLIHAICDALLGAAGLRDIGYHFPDNREEFRGIASSILLKEVCKMLANDSYQISNIDCTVVLEKPKIASYIGKMQEELATILGIKNSQVSVKATTTEGMGFEGKEEGISAYAVALIYKS